jgi:filamentous hemagglutinin family protein
MFANRIEQTISLAAMICLLPLSVAAQIAPDGTTATTVDRSGNNLTVEGGDRAGSNLFHSFREFSVSNGTEAFFNNAADVSNIFSRVTGGNVSNIDGAIRANDANLFLINPAGVLFGSGGRLDLGGGSFYGSSADSILFEDGEFSATDLENPPLLTVNAPIGLSFRDNPAPIAVNGSNLGVASGESLVLVGGEVTLDGANLFAPGGNIAIGGLAAGTVNFTDNLSLDFPETATKADVFLTNASGINVSETGGGAIAIEANNLTIDAASNLSAGIRQDTNTPDAIAGNISINASDTVSLDGQSNIANNVGANSVGDAGNINITATNLAISDRSSVGSLVQGRGDSGKVSIDLSDRLNLADGSSIRTQILETGEGNANDVEIAANSIELDNSSSELNDSALIFSNTSGRGDTGNLTISADERIVLRDSNFSTQVLPNAIGNAGNIEITTGELAVISSDPTAGITSRILTNTRGQGNAGNINIETDNILLDRGAITSQVATDAEGNAGTIAINSGTATLQNRSQVLSGTDGVGDAGKIIINADDDITIDRRTLIVSQVRPNGEGNAGSIEITAGNSLLARDFSLISTNTQEGGVGEGGNLLVRGDNITLTEGAILDSLTENNNNGGSITVEARTLDVTAGGKITTGTDRAGDAGSINLNIEERTNIDGENAPQAPAGEEFEEQLLNDLETQTGLFANSTENSTGNSGSIIINTPGTVTVANDAEVTVNNDGTGNSGNLAIDASSLTVDNGGQLIAETASSTGDRELGNITLEIEDTVNLIRDGRISARAFNDANGGNIDINSQFVVAFAPLGEGNDIIASAQEGTGGNINLVAEGIFGLQERKATENNNSNDIDASSDFGFDGEVSIETPDVESVQVEFSGSVVESDDYVSQVCSADPVADASSFVIQGRGGIPPQPVEPFTADSIIVDGKTSTSENRAQRQLQEQYPPIATNSGYIYPARGVIVGKNGEVILTAYPVGDNPQRNLVASANCAGDR